jgi:hypothetical protein
MSIDLVVECHTPEIDPIASYSSRLLPRTTGRPSRSAPLPCHGRAVRPRGALGRTHGWQICAETGRGARSDRALRAPLSLSQIKSGRTDDVIRRELGSEKCARWPEQPVVPVRPCSEINVSSRHCRTRRRDAHRTEERKVLYPWHPWAGCLVHVHEVVEKASGEVFRCNREGGRSSCWLELPNWMFDQTSCAAMRLCDGVPSVDIGALSALTSLLREVAAYAGSSNARLSGVARASHDQNQGDAHAMPYEPLSRPSTPSLPDRLVRANSPRRHLEYASVGQPSRRDAPVADTSHGAPHPRSREGRSRAATRGDAP